MGREVGREIEDEKPMKPACQKLSEWRAMGLCQDGGFVLAQEECVGREGDEEEEEEEEEERTSESW